MVILRWLLDFEVGAIIAKGGLKEIMIGRWFVSVGLRIDDVLYQLM